MPLQQNESLISEQQWWAKCSFIDVRGIIRKSNTAMWNFD